MKTLIFMRHGKSSWDVNHLDDSLRPLLPVGAERNARSLAYLVCNDVKPDIIVSSPALRALDTARFLIEHSYWDNVGLVTEQSLYFQGIDGYDSAIFSIDNQFETAMIVGHNPMLTEMVNRFKMNQIENFPTSALFGLRLHGEKWEDLYDCKREELFFVRPKKM